MVELLAVVSSKELKMIKVVGNEKIPIVTIFSRGEIFIPTPADLESGVITSLQRSAEVLSVGGEHEFLVHSSPPAPHTTLTSHQVWWVNQKQSQPLSLRGTLQITPWTTNSWEQMLNDAAFLKGAEGKFSVLQSNNSKLRVYFVFGFANEDDKRKVVDMSVIPRSSQSQYRAHFHVVEAIPTNAITWKNANNMKIAKLNIFFNFSGELAIANYINFLRSFGRKFTYNQPVSTPDTSIYSVSRTMFSFTSLQEALGGVIELNKQVFTTWLKVANKVAQHQVCLAGECVKIMQGCVPGFTVMRPSQDDRKLMKLSSDDVWLVAPFALPLPQTLLGSGVLLNRE